MHKKHIPFFAIFLFNAVLFVLIYKFAKTTYLSVDDAKINLLLLGTDTLSGDPYVFFPHIIYTYFITLINKLNINVNFYLVFLCLTQIFSFTIINFSLVKFFGNIIGFLVYTFLFVAFLLKYNLAVNFTFNSYLCMASMAMLATIMLKSQPNKIKIFSFYGLSMFILLVSSMMLRPLACISASAIILTAIFLLNFKINFFSKAKVILFCFATICILYAIQLIAYNNKEIKSYREKQSYLAKLLDYPISQKAIQQIKDTNNQESHEIEPNNISSSSNAIDLLFKRIYHYEIYSNHNLKNFYQKVSAKNSLKQSFKEILISFFRSKIHYSILAFMLIVFLLLCLEKKFIITIAIKILLLFSLIFTELVYLKMSLYIQGYVFSGILLCFITGLLAIFWSSLDKKTFHQKKIYIGLAILFLFLFLSKYKQKNYYKKLLKTNYDIYSFCNKFKEGIINNKLNQYIKIACPYHPLYNGFNFYKKGELKEFKIIMLGWTSNTPYFKKFINHYNLLDKNDLILTNKNSILINPERTLLKDFIKEQFNSDIKFKKIYTSDYYIRQWNRGFGIDIYKARYSSNAF